MACTCVLVMPNLLVLHTFKVFRMTDEQQNWTQDLLLQINIGKYSVLHFGPNSPVANYTIFDPTTKLREQLETGAEERDLGVIIDDKFEFHSHIQHAASC